ncbi:hypothetical protein ACVTD6_12505 [Vibrio cholerae]
MIIDKYKIHEFLVLICIFLITLENHGEFRLYISILLIIAAYIIKSHGGISKRVISSGLKFIAILSVISLLAAFDFLTYKSNMLNYGVESFYISNILKICLSLLVINIIFNDKQAQEKIIKGLVILHLTAFYTQFLFVYATGYYIDLLLPFTDEASRYTWQVTVPFIGQTYRPTGFYNEPSTYSAFILCIILIRNLITGKFDKLDVAAIFSLFASLSFASIIYGVLFILIINLRGSRALKYLPLILFLIVIISPMIVDMLEARTSGDYDAIGLRAGLFQVFMSQSYTEILLGNGPIGVPNEIEFLVNNANVSWAKNGLPALNDNGLFMFIIMKFGFLGCLLLLFYMKKHLHDIGEFLLHSIILMTKIKYTSAIFIIYIILLSLRKSIKDNEQC